MQTSIREASDKAAAGFDRLTSTAHQAVDRVASAASATAQQFTAKSDEWIDTTRAYVRQHPFAALGAALAVGFLVSRLIR